MNVEAAVWEIAEQQYGVVGRRQLNELAIDNQVLRPLLRREILVPLSGRVLRVSGTEPGAHQAAMAAVLDGPPGAVLSHRSAAALWGLPGFELVEPFHVTVPRQGRARRNDLCVVHFHKEMPLDEVVIRGGIPVTSPALTLFHLAAVLHPAKTERTLDNALARRLLSVRKYHVLVKRLGASGRNGTRVSRELAEARLNGYRPPESGFEQRVEWCAGEAGVEVERQVSLGDHEYVGRADFRLVGSNGVIEAQSALYHATPLDEAADQGRVARLLAAGLCVLFVWDRQVFANAPVVIREIRRFHRDVMHGTTPFFRECPDE
jgi:very-short-patch-repair endonuclease